MLLGVGIGLGFFQLWAWTTTQPQARACCVNVEALATLSRADISPKPWVDVPPECDLRRDCQVRRFAAAASVYGAARVATSIGVTTSIKQCQRASTAWLHAPRPQSEAAPSFATLRGAHSRGFSCFSLFPAAQGNPCESVLGSSTHMSLHGTPSCAAPCETCPRGSRSASCPCPC